MVTARKVKITAIDQPGDSKTGRLKPGLSVQYITSVLGFPPNVVDDVSKVKHSWGFKVDGVRCGIWDYCGGRWTVYDPNNVLCKIFKPEDFDD